MSGSTGVAAGPAGWHWPGWATPLGLLNAVAPRAGVRVLAGLRYGPGPRHLADAYLPAGGGGRAPVVVFFYGGSWAGGERGWYRFVAAALAAQGVLAVVPDYRVYPQVRFPAFLEDAAAAVAHVRAAAPRFGGDPARMVLMGHSAGAHIAAMLALQPGWLAAAPAGVIGLAGPYDFLPLETPLLQGVFGPEAQWPQTQPVNFASGSAPPMLLLSGGLDRTVLPRNTLRLAQRLRAAGAPVRARIYPLLEHTLLLGALARPLRAPLAWLGAPVLRDCLAFIARPEAVR